MNKQLVIALFAACLMILWQPANAQDDQPFVEVSVKPDAVRVGESLRLEVIILVPTWFSGTPVFPSFELTNSITRLPPDSAYPTSRRISGETWSGIVRHYEVTPLVPARFELRDQQIKVKWANPGKPAYEAIVDVPDISYRGTVPDGAEGLSPYVAGTSFLFRRSITAPEVLSPGDAITIELSAELEGMPAIFIPQLFQLTELPGARIYPAEPVVEDNARSERVTLILDQPGQLTLPEREIAWWNTQTGQIERVRSEAITLNIAGASTTKTDDDARSSNWVLYLLSLTILIGFGFALHTLYANRPVDLEQNAYRSARSALKARNATESYHAFMKWSSAVQEEPALDKQVFDAKTLTALEQLRRSLYTDSSVSIDYATILSGLERARKKLHQRNVQQKYELPALNP